MDPRAEIVAHAANDVGGLPAGPFVPTDHPLLPWEKRMHALADVLAAKGIVNVEEKRRGIEELGKELYGQLSYYETWALSVCHNLLAKGIISAQELAHKLTEVRAREADHGREVCP
jgi:hypothetical protein